MYVYISGEVNLGDAVWVPPFERRRLGAADWAPDNWVPCRLGAGHLGAGHLGAVSQFYFIFLFMKKKQ